MGTHSSIPARACGKMSRFRSHWSRFQDAPVGLSSPQKQARKKSANAKRRRRDKAIG
jgi:hypothetical protein